MKNTISIKNQLIDNINYQLDENYEIDKNVNDLFYELDVYNATIYVTELKKNKVVNTIVINIFKSKTEERKNESDSLISGFSTKYLLSFSKELNDYVILDNFPVFEIEFEDEDDEVFFEKVNTVKKDLTFDELILSLSKIKRLDASKIGIDDKVDLRLCD